jgi:hypothetical protein
MHTRAMRTIAQCAVRGVRTAWTGVRARCVRVCTDGSVSKVRYVAPATAAFALPCAILAAFSASTVRVRGALALEALRASSAGLTAAAVCTIVPRSDRYARGLSCLLMVCVFVRTCVRAMYGVGACVSIVCSVPRRSIRGVPIGLVASLPRSSSWSFFTGTLAHATSMHRGGLKRRLHDRIRSANLRIVESSHPRARLSTIIETERCLSGCTRSRCKLIKTIRGPPNRSRPRRLWSRQFLQASVPQFECRIQACTESTPCNAGSQVGRHATG